MTDQRGALLTARETRILQLIAEGMSDAAVAKELSISPKTVNYHVENIKRQFAVPTRIQAVVKAMRMKVIF
jgi:DNA-binding CsgD family transcriptional regulator